MQYIPSHIQIETVNRYCNARCPMCTIKFVPEANIEVADEQAQSGVARQPEFMTLDTFKAIADKCLPFIDKIEKLSLHGCGEPLMDKTLPEKIHYAKQIGFNGIGFTSNCGLLKNKLSKRLLDAGLNCIIPSIDGLTKNVHETIRPGINFDRTIEYLKYFIQYRDDNDLDCKVLIRMVRQQLNHQQWEDYQLFWNDLLNPEKGDDVITIDIHNTGGKVENFDNMKVDGYTAKIDQYQEQMSCQQAELCPDLFSRLSIYASGDVSLCSADQSSYYDLGNVLTQDPLDIYNNKVFTHYREEWLDNNFMALNYCKDCTIAISRQYKSYS